MSRTSMLPASKMQMLRPSARLSDTWCRASLLVLCLWTVAAFRHGRSVESQDGIEKRKPHVEHRSFRSILGAWLLENSTLAAMSLLMNGLFPPRRRGDTLKTFTHNIAISMMITEGTWFIQTFYASWVYSGIPYFAPLERRPPRPSLEVFLHNWVRLIFPIRIAGGIGEVRHLHTVNEQEYGLLVRGDRFAGPVKFLLQFAVARAFHDLAFFVGHWLIHQRQLYSWIHKKHHEHHEPSILTNAHFTVLDLVIEAGFSVSAAIAALGFFKQAGFSLSNLERSYIIYALIWYENGSHVGKGLPCVTFLPPLSFLPVIDRVLGGGVAHHHAHHRYVNCNYSIAAWPDKVCGTCRPLVTRAVASDATIEVPPATAEELHSESTGAGSMPTAPVQSP